MDRSKITLPDVIFSPWFKWEERSRIPNDDHPGVYVLAHFDKTPRGRADPLSREIIDIGETTKKTIRSRLNYFHRAAFRGAVGIHSAGETYRLLFKDIDKTLWVSSFIPIDLDEPILMLFIKFIERKLILEYANRWGKPPVCNKS